MRVVLHNGCGIQIDRAFASYYLKLGLLIDCGFPGLPILRVRRDLKAYANYLDGGLLFRRLRLDPIVPGDVGSCWYNVLLSEAFLLIEDANYGEYADWKKYDSLQRAYRHKNGERKKQKPLERRDHLPTSVTDQKHYGYKGY